MSSVACGKFADDFNRPDSPNIGNGWIEKNPDGFSLSGGAVITNPSSLVGHWDNIVYRPASEDLLDVEASVEIQLFESPPGFPQLHVRVQSVTVGSPNILDSYIIFVNSSNTEAILGRQRGPNLVLTLAVIAIDPPLNTTDKFRLRLRAKGTNPVELTAFVERFTNGAWQVIGQGVASDSSADRLASAGSVGFSGGPSDYYHYDNFTRTVP
jgi:hypothetical protein